jgi:hypothetical protein
MDDESPSAELERLRRRQLITRQNEVYGGLAKAERAEYETGAKCIDALIKAMALFDTQSEARQPYRSREQDPTTAFVDAVKKEAVKRTRNREN